MNCANHPDRERVSFCQNCGKPLCAECTRAVGAGVFCETCLAARLAAADAAASSGFAAAPNYTAVPSAAVPLVPGTPNPGLAALLGFIPGVGAMYNGQYAKGVVHLIVFAALVSLGDSVGIFKLFVAGWVFYQVFEAYHTARARRDGAPLPNPFGLNDVGERFGFGKAWPSPGPTPGAVPPPASVPPNAPPDAPFTAANAANSASWGAPAYTYTHPETPIPPTPPHAPPVPPFTETYASPYTDAQPLPPSRFPVAAIWLIALGLLFFFGSTGFLLHFPIQRLIPFLLIGLGVWVFIHKMTSTGQTLAGDGTPAYRLRVFRALRGSVWIILVGVLFLLDSFYILSWGHSWPLFIIVAGVMSLLERSAYTAVPPLAYGYPPAGTVPGQPPASDSSSPTGTSIAPRVSHDQEGS